jgi:DNA-binding protein HU-beta
MHTDLLPHHTRNLLPFGARDLLPLVFRWLFPFFANAKAYGQALAIESRKEQALWNSRAKVVRENIAKGHEVRLMGFGTWNVRNVAARTVTSIHGGNPITIPARKLFGFSARTVLSQAVERSPAKAKATSATRPGAAAAAPKR